MDTNSLCVGNIVSLAYKPEVITTIVMVEVGGAVQVTCNDNTDDIRDITGVPLSREILERFQIPRQFNSPGGEISISNVGDDVSIFHLWFKKPVSVRYLHQLQNIVSFLTGADIINRKLRV